MVVLDAQNGSVVYWAEIGGGSDSMVFDPATRRLFSANGINANLSIFEQINANTYKAVETLALNSGLCVRVAHPARLNFHAILGYVSTEHDVRQQRGHFGLPRAADLFHHLP